MGKVTRLWPKDDKGLHWAIRQEYQKLVDAGLVEPLEKMLGQLSLKQHADGRVEIQGDPKLLDVLRVMLIANEALGLNGEEELGFDPDDAA